MNENENVQIDLGLTDGDLESLIQQQVAQTVGESTDTVTEQNVADGVGSTSEKLDGSEELETFFNQWSQEDADQKEDPNYTKDQEEETEEEDSEEEQLAEADQEDPQEEETADEEVSLLDIIREERLLDIPEDFEGDLTEDKIEEFKRSTYERRDWEIIRARRSVFANDPEKLELFDYLMTAEEDADLPRFRSIQEEVKEFSDYDISEQDNQREILTQWLKEGLDPDNPAHRLRLSKVNGEVDNIIEEGKGEELSKQAKDYFVSKAESRKQQELQRAAQLKQLKQQQIEAQRQREEAWHRGFMESLSSQSLPEEKKRALYEEQYGTVQLNNGEEVPVWYAKELVIKSDPRLYQQYLDWLSSSFDLGKRAFINKASEDVDDVATRKILKLANSKKSKKKSRSSSRQNTGRRVIDGGNTIVDPLAE